MMMGGMFAGHDQSGKKFKLSLLYIVYHDVVEKLLSVNLILLVLSL